MKTFQKAAFAFLLTLLVSGFSGYQVGDPTEPTVLEQLDIAPVWAGHPVGFALLTSAPHQYVAYYDADRQMTVAHRQLGQKKWDYQKLPTRVGWDSHNYIAMALDKAGHLHLSGNMHSDSLKYFYATKPHDIHSIRRMPSMTGKAEAKTTYPEFFTAPSGDLVFAYRDGSSGSGNQIYNTYDIKQKSWRRLLDTPFTDGEGLMNAYLRGPMVGPDGFYHIVWVWRDTPDASTNHDLCYARSKDLLHWEKSDGSPLRLPIKLASAEIVDPVPAKGGIINGNTVLGFDAQKRPVITYHKYDQQGNIQIYNARREASGWKIKQATDWTHRWEFGGGGTIEFEVGVHPVQVGKSGDLTMAYRSKGAGNGLLVLDPVQLKVTEKRPYPALVPTRLQNPESSFPGMQVSFREDGGKSPVKGTHYVLRWETLGRNRDRPRQGPLPEASSLRLYQIRE
ncbi:BNR repeat-containing protein [Tellurirhabdus bombi]|uniref:BNR repeat-containing protein n=1 Tax=Tellurirhabdus bombi TaxID=2907205 RepID=UPI001F28679A|nr:BNR repeat-containing protein [Tellurirhabdus bombi]